MRKYLFILFASLTTLTLSGQQEECDKIRDEIPLSVQGTSDLTPLLIRDLAVIEKCIEFDSIDKQMISPGALGLLLFRWSVDKPDLRYSNFIDSLNIIMMSEEYLAQKEGIQLASDLENSQVMKTDSQEVRGNLNKIGFTESEITEIMKVISLSDNPDLTYKEAVATFIASEESTAIQKNQLPVETELLFGHFNEIDLSINLKQQDNDKTILLYFTGYASVAGRKLETALFNESEIQSLFEEYECYIGYADDKSTISPLQQEEFPEIEMRNKGQYIMEIEKSVYPKGSQPTLIVVDSNFKLVDSFENSRDKQDFIDFLKRNKYVR